MADKENVDRFLGELFGERRRGITDPANPLMQIVYRVVDGDRLDISGGKSKEERYFQIAKNFRNWWKLAESRFLQSWIYGGAELRDLEQYAKALLSIFLFEIQQAGGLVTQEDLNSIWSAVKERDFLPPTREWKRPEIDRQDME